MKKKEKKSIITIYYTAISWFIIGINILLKKITIIK